MQELESHKFRRFEITDFEDKDFEYPERDHARVRVRLNWATLHQTVSKNATLHFVRRNGRWYFSDLLSYKFPWIWFLPLLALPIAYAGCGVFMFVHIYGRLWPNLKSRMRWTFLIFVPFSLIFYLRARPWARVAR